jgi:hypothetical protein
MQYTPKTSQKPLCWGGFKKKNIFFILKDLFSGNGTLNPTRGVSAQLKAKVGSTLAKAAALRINLNIDEATMPSRTHTHPSHSQTSRLLTSSLSLGVPVPRVTQCIRGV